MMPVTRIVSCLLVGMCLGPIVAQDARVPAKHALLIGVTQYDDPAVKSLTGPGNDVLLMQDFLQKRFGFAAANITILSEAKGGTQRPTRAHIEREMARLAKIAKAGDQIVILMSGHGSRQPQRVTDANENYEPDGLDNIFLPADFKSFDAKTNGTQNVVVDDDLKVWLQAIRDQGASVLIVVDACHSATMIRGSEAEVLREVPVEQIFPKEILEAAKARAAKNATERGGGERPPFILPDQTSNLVAIYAAQRTEPTVERPLPPKSADAKPYGILTYSLVQIVSNSPKPITYTELVQRIQAQYIEWERSFPTPLVEGKDKDKEFLGAKEWKGRSAMQVSQNDDGEYRLNAGALHRLTAGSILAVFPPAGSANADQPLGHVRVQQLRSMDAIVEPCAFAKLAAPKTIPAANRCVVVYTDYSGALRLTLAIDGEKTRSASVDKLSQELERLSKSPDSLFKLAKDAASADWLVRVQGDQAILVPGSGMMRGEGTAPAFYGPAAIDDQVGGWLQNRLGRIVRARNLVALAAATQSAQLGGDGPDVGLEILRYPDPNEREKFEVVKAQGRGLVFEAGDIIAFRISNRNRFALDVSLLFVDSGHGILPVFPRANTVTDNRLAAGKSLVTGPSRINAKTVELEHLVLIAVKARTDEQPADFGFLAQPTLELASKLRGPKDVSLTSPLGQLFQNGLYGADAQRGMSNETFGDNALQVISWHAKPRQVKP